MDRGVKPAKAKVEAKRPAGRMPAATDDARVHDLETRLAEALEQQAATSEILRVISASPSDVQPVLDAVAERAAQLCKAPFARVLLVDGDVLHCRADYSVDGRTPIPVVPVALKRTTVSGRAVLESKIVNLADIVPMLDTEFPDARENTRRTGFRACLAVPLLREAGAYGAIFLWRREPGLFAPDQVALVQTFARQAAIAIENVRLFKEVNARNGDLAEALEQQEATSEILRAIASSPTDIQPVLETLVRAAARFCGAPDVALLRVDGGVLRGAAAAGAFGEMLIRRSGGIEALEIPLTRESVSGRAAVERRSVHVHDLATESEDEYPMGRELQRRLGHRTMVAMPLLREGVTVGVIDLFRTEVKPFSDKQVELLRTFADQAVIAIENVRLFTELGTRNRDLTVALEQQTATSEILRTISSSPTDVQPVFDVIGERAERLCDAEFSVVSKIDGELIRMVALHGMSAEGRDSVGRHFPMRLDAETVTARTIRRRAVVHVADALADPDYESKDAALAGGYRSCLGVPMFREGEVIGSIFVARRKPGLFTDSQVQLLKTFADQAVIAIENVRLFTELDKRNRDLTEALEQQTATSEILRVISSSPTDVQPVFDIIAQRAGKLCDAEVAVVSRFDGKLIELAAIHGLVPEGVTIVRTLFPMQVDAQTVTARVVRDAAVVHLADVFAEQDYGIKDFARAAQYRSALGVPIRRNQRVIGVIFVGRVKPGKFADSQIELLRTFADQAVIAIENVRLFKELEARTTELTQSVGELKALGEVGQAVSSTLDLATVLSTIVSRATQLTGMDGGAIYEYDEAREQFHLQTTDRLPADLVAALRAAPMRKGEGAIGKLAVTGLPVEIRDIADEGAYQSRIRKLLVRLGYRSLLAVPLLREDHLLGGLVVNRKSTGAFAPDVIDLLKTFATQSALAIQNARLFREIGDKSRQLEIASQHKSEFLANMSHELRTPLNAIIGFSEVLAERMFGEINDKQAEYLADILESGRHLLSLINDILDLSKIEAGRMELDLADFDLPGAIDNTMTLVRERAHRRGIVLERNVDARVGKVRGDERKVKQVLLNLLSNALKFTPEGGRIGVRADVRDGGYEISVTDTGVGIAPEDLDAVFEEFRQVGSAAKKVEGTGLGLAISRKFIELHGGKIWATSQVGIGSTFAFTLPLTTTQRPMPPG